MINIQKIFSKKLNIIIALILVIAVIIGIYTFNRIEENVQKMAEAGGETVDFVPKYPTPNYEGKNKAVIDRGEYLTKAGDCIACHTNTPDEGASFAGGLPMETPFGTLYSPNITPDKETGIGGWSDDDFVRAMREGISPHGKHYYPAFPYLYFNKVTTADLLAIKAYLDSIPPVHQQNRENKMVWPFNWRFLQSGWRLLFFFPNKTGPYEADLKQSAEWNRGAYLVEGLGHCAMCHTPSHYLISEKFSLGAPIQKYNLTGAKVQGFLAPNITKTNLANIPNEELVKVFTHNQMVGGGNIEGPMLEANLNSLQYLTHDDLLAIATYIKSVQSQTPPKPKPGKGGVGEVVYQSYCEGCHATGAGGAPKFGDPASWSEPLKQGLDKVYENAIKGIGGMPAKGTCYSCDDSDIKLAVEYMIASVSGKESKVSPQLKKLTLEDGKRIYEAECSVCHKDGFKNAPRVGDKTVWEPMVNAGFVNTYLNAITGRTGHPPHAGCATCTDADIKAAVKYMMTESSNKDYSLW